MKLFKIEVKSLKHLKALVKKLEGQNWHDPLVFQWVPDPEKKEYWADHPNIGPKDYFLMGPNFYWVDRAEMHVWKCMTPGNPTPKQWKRMEPKAAAPVLQEYMLRAMAWQLGKGDNDDEK